MYGTKRTNWAGLTMSVDRGRPEVAFRGRQDRSCSKADVCRTACQFDSGSFFHWRHYFCECCLCSGVWTGLDHSVVSYEKLGSRVDSKAVEKRLQLGPESVAAKRGNRVKLTHDALLCV